MNICQDKVNTILNWPENACVYFKQNKYMCRQFFSLHLAVLLEVGIKTVKASVEYKYACTF